MSHVLGNFHAAPAKARPLSSQAVMRLAVAGCAAFWVAVGVGIAHAVGG